MNELTLDGKTYVSSKRAAEITGYAKDYVGQLCREGHVEARLVGRNWYVLESSIRSHRFGKASIEENAPREVDSATSSWSNPKYIAEEPAPLPVLSPEKAAEAEAVIPSTTDGTGDQRAILTDMESAWQDWFVQKEAENVPVAVDEAPIEEVVEEPVEVESEIPAVAAMDDGSVQVHTERLVVAEPQDQVLDLSHGTVEYPEPEAPAPQAQVIEERIYIKKRPSAVHRLTIQSAFVGAALIAVAVAVVGTGFAQKILGSSLYRLPEINIIAGVSEINK